MFLVWIRGMSRRPAGSGTRMPTSRSNRPNRCRVGSTESGRLVVAVTMTSERALKPSRRVNSWETTRRSTPLSVFSRIGKMGSVSSMKMTAGGFFSASSNAFRRLPSNYPAILLTISAPSMRKKKAASLRFICDHPDHKRLTSTWVQDTPRGLDTDRLEQLRTAEGDFDQLANLDCLLRAAARIVVAHFVEICHTSSRFTALPSATRLVLRDKEETGVKHTCVNDCILHDDAALRGGNANRLEQGRGRCPILYRVVRWIRC